MLNQQDMTEKALRIYNELSSEPATAGEIAQNTGTTFEACEFILTQLMMGGLSEFKAGCYTRPQ